MGYFGSKNALDSGFTFLGSLASPTITFKAYLHWQSLLAKALAVLPINFANGTTTIGSHTNQEAKASAARQVGFVQCH